MHPVHNMQQVATQLPCTSSVFCSRHAGFRSLHIRLVQQLAQQPLQHKVLGRKFRRTYERATRQYGHTNCTLGEGTQAAVSSGNSGIRGPGGQTALVWFKHDLRLDDHPGLHHAITSGGSIIPVFCLDPRQCLHTLRLPKGIEGLLGAVKALRESLQQVGSNLVVLSGNMEEVIPQAAVQYGASSIILEEEVEYKWHKAVDKVQAALLQDVTMQPWRLQIFGQQPYPPDYTAFKKQRGTATHPVDRPDKLPALPAGVELGELPSAEEVKAAIKAAFEGKQTAEVLRTAA